MNTPYIQQPTTALPDVSIRLTTTWDITRIQKKKEKKKKKKRKKKKKKTPRKEILLNKRTEGIFAIQRISKRQYTQTGYNNSLVVLKSIEFNEYE